MFESPRRRQGFPYSAGVTGPVAPWRIKIESVVAQLDYDLRRSLRDALDRCGIEGVDERVIEARGLEEVSIGDYVLSGGEIAAMVLIDACVRLLPGVMGAAASSAEESFTEGLLEYPHYTRPQTWEDQGIPEVLLSGDHAKIAAWRRAEAERLTSDRRPDLWQAFLHRSRGGGSRAE